MPDRTILTEYLLNNNRPLFDKYVDYLSEYINDNYDNYCDLLILSLNDLIKKYKLYDVSLRLIKSMLKNFFRHKFYLPSYILNHDPNTINEILQLVPVESLTDIVNDILAHYKCSPEVMKHLFTLNCHIGEYTYDRIIDNCALFVGYDDDNEELEKASLVLKFILDKINLEEYFSQIMEYLLIDNRYKDIEMVINHPNFNPEFLNHDAPGSLSYEELLIEYGDELGYDGNESIGLLALKYLMKPETIDLAYKILIIGSLYHELSDKCFKSRLQYLHKYIEDNNLPTLLSHIN